MSAYNETDPVPIDLDVTTPTEGDSPPSEINNAIREIKRAFKNSYATVAKSGNYTLTETDTVVLVSDTATITLPAVANVSSSTFTKYYTIVNVGSSKTVTLKTAAAGETLDTVDYSSTGLALTTTATVKSLDITVCGNGTNWRTVGRNLAAPFIVSPVVTGTITGGGNFATTSITKDGHEIATLSDNASTTSTTVPTTGGVTLLTLDLGTVTDGDWFILQTQSSGTKATAGQVFITISKSSGTATAALLSSGTSLATHDNLPDTQVYALPTNSVWRVTGSGTLVMKVVGQLSAGTVTGANNSIGVIFLKRQ